MKEMFVVFVLWCRRGYQFLFFGALKRRGEKNMQDIGECMKAFTRNEINYERVRQKTSTCLSTTFLSLGASLPLCVNAKLHIVIFTIRGNQFSLFVAAVKTM